MSLPRAPPAPPFPPAPLTPFADVWVTNVHALAQPVFGPDVMIVHEPAAGHELPPPLPPLVDTPPHVFVPPLVYWRVSAGLQSPLPVAASASYVASAAVKSVLRPEPLPPPPPLVPAEP